MIDFLYSLFDGRVLCIVSLRNRCVAAPNVERVEYRGELRVNTRTFTFTSQPLLFYCLHLLSQPLPTLEFLSCHSCRNFRLITSA